MFTGNYNAAKVDRITDFLYDHDFYKIGIAACDYYYSVECELYTENGCDMIVSFVFDDDDEIESPACWGHELYDYAQDFDPLAEAMMWVDEAGQGINGAPGNVITLYNDFCEWANELVETAVAVFHI